MPKSQRSSHASETCRVEWRPSRLLAAALPALGAMGAFAACASEMPRAAAVPLAATCLLHGAWAALRSMQASSRTLVWNGHAGTATLDGVLLAMPRLHWRGPIAILCWRADSWRGGRLVWWPDTLPASRRRELKLAAGEAGGAPSANSVAP